MVECLIIPLMFNHSFDFGYTFSFVHFKTKNVCLPLISNMLLLACPLGSTLGSTLRQLPHDTNV